MTSLADKNLVKFAVEAYNNRNPDEDDLNYEYVLKELTYSLELLQRDLKGFLLDQKIIWHDNTNFSDYLLPGGEAKRLIEDEDVFKNRVFKSVQIITKEN